MATSFNPQRNSARPDTVNLNKSADIFRFVGAKKEGLTLIYPKGYVPVNKVNPYVKSPFGKHQLVTKTLKAYEHPPGEGWVFVALVSVFVLLLSTRRINPKKLGTYLSASYNRRALNEIFNEENILTSPFSLMMFVAFCLTGSLFITKLVGVSTLFGFTALQAFGIVALGLFVVYTFKILAIQFIGLVFRQNGVAKQYAFNVYLLNNILGLILIPIVAIAYYSGQPADTWALYIGSALFALFFVLRFLKSLSIEGVIAPVNLMYLFLYLCTLEILPLLVAIKVVNTYL